MVFRAVPAALAQGGALVGRVRTLHDAALAWHDDVALTEVAPARRDREIVAGHVAAIDGGGHGDGGYLRAQCALGDAGDGRIGVQQRGKLPASRRRRGQRVSRSGVVAAGPARKRDARPLHTERPGVRLAVGGIVKHGEDVMKQVLHA